MGLKEKIFGKQERREATVLPAGIMQQEDAVNYNSVLDYLVGLSDRDYKKMTGSAEIYRKANKEVAKLIGVKDEPTTSISNERTEVSDDELDAMLDAPAGDLATAFIEDDIPVAKPKKAHSTEKKIEVKD